MDYIFLLLSFILSVFRHSLATPVIQSCEDDVHLICGSKDFHDALNDDGFSLLNENTLSLHCRDIIEDIDCKRDYLTTCDPSGAESFTLATDGIKDVLADLCNVTTSLRKAYHEHSPCISSASQDYEDCILNTATSAANVDEYDSNENDIVSNDETVQRMCRFYDPFKFCVTQVTRRMCGDSAAQLVEQLIVRMATPVISAKCPSRTK